MNNFKFSKTSEWRLSTVKTKLQHIVRLALSMSEVDFTVVEGRRSEEVQQALYAQGREPIQRVNELRVAAGLPTINKDKNYEVTWTLNSKHITGDAVDLAPYINGSIDWNNTKAFHKIADAMMEASKQLNAPIKWGVISKSKRIDLPHYELV